MQYKILIVDDDREMLKNFFEIKKYSIFTAEDGMHTFISPISSSILDHTPGKIKE